MWRKLLRVARRALPYLRNAAPSALILTLISVIAAIWWLGPGWQMAGAYPLASWQPRALMTMGAVLLVVVLWGWTLARKLARVNRARTAVSRETEDPVLVYERRQQRLLDQQLRLLKARLPGRHREYRLPWYLVVGLQGGGKTSLVHGSGHNFTLIDDPRRGFDDTNPYGLAWWIGDDGVVIDPDGALMDQSDNGAVAEVQQRLWQQFLEWLNHARPQRPLNGVVLAIDLAHFARESSDQRRARAMILRGRLRELMEQLRSRLPVYVSFTKMDLLHGFSTFFRQLPETEREQPLGFTFQVNLQADQDDWQNQFETQYAALINALNQRLPDILAACREGEDRAAAFSFSRQLAGLKDGILQFLVHTLSVDAFSAPALVRGVYFTSVLQEGVPEDAFVTAAAATYSLREPTQAAQSGRLPRAYFSAGLFPKVIFPEAGLAGDSLPVVRQRRHRRMMAATLAACTGLAMTAGWHHYFSKNAEAATAVEQGVQKFIDHWRPLGFEAEASGRNLLDPLDWLREATLAFGEYRDVWPMVADMGLYQGDRVGGKVESTYLDMLAYQFLPALMLGVAEQMSHAPDDSPERLQHLRVLRMLYDGSGRRADVVVNYMNRYWQRRYPGQREVQRRLRTHLDHGLAHTDLAARVRAGDPHATLTLAPFQNSVQWAQQDLGRMSTPDRVYRSLGRDAASSLKAPLNLAQQIGPGFGVVFTRLDEHGEPLAETQGASATDDPLQIPAMLTRQGLDHYFLKKSEAVIELALIDAWVLGRRDNVDFSQSDETQLQSQVQALYAGEYVSRWRQALSRVDIQRFRDLNHGVRVLDSLSGSHQPLTQLLLQVQKNTRLTPGADPAAPGFYLMQDIERQFEHLNQVLVKEGELPSALKHLHDALTSLHIYMRGIQEAPDRGKAALVAARARLGLQGEDPIFTVQRLAANQPAPLDRLLTRLASESWRVLLDEAVAQLERRWYQDVYLPFQQTLARHYPFTPDATRDAALQDFERFFAPEGTLNRFYMDHLKLFLEDHPEQVQGAQRASLVRRDVKTALGQANQIRRAFFTRGGSLDVEFALEPRHLSSNKRRSVVNVDGQLVEFSHGPRQSIPLVWPNTLRDAVESRITLVPTQVNRSPRSESTQGPWALFRLLDKADITGISSSAVDVKFSIDGGEMRYRLHAGSNTNPFTQQLLAGYRIPRYLY
ncbi:type VI secretion system membrane subunit TssM [Marinobacter sp. X15-166B]|uniref:type VI secretion system membrane subunit TssM n=1 Tax=Marinobacter sp. X15-166B TaxID=1897620 RepID=UPI00085C9269|nr:type VI secretion system membrane subunit TssM [Marinobacter sp. X15-166B]OEY65821.1 Fis family transcriptional regulator [Marinobacter sp. X15-166B]